jgi:hypothetical protein
MTDKLSVYRGVARAVGERKIAALDENTKIRRLIDGVWADDAGVPACLSAAFWNFAMEEAEVTYSPTVSPQFGFRRAFEKPTDWVRTFCVSNEGQFSNGLYRFKDIGEYWFADDDAIYASFVSKSVNRGMDLSLWTPNFCSYVHDHIGSMIVVDLEGSRSAKEELDKSARRKMNVARATDAMDESMRFRPQGGWASARRGGFSSRGRSREHG